MTSARATSDLTMWVWSCLRSPPALPAGLPFTDDLACKFAWERPNQRDPVWPHFPAVTAYLSGEAAELLQLKAPIRARVTDHSYQCATQAAAATKTIALIAYTISKKTRAIELPPEDAEDISNFTDTILYLCATSAVCSSRIAAWQTLLQRQMWLCLFSSISKVYKKGCWMALSVCMGCSVPIFNLCWSTCSLS
ncbi:hypothetical protein GOODEAATRI_003435 [Goodea atripinnis]|uniref:Uncharacterized protein n=1 Tax=Goodea atripinnis TaxID=208336 RepID=A0ABV0NUW0_9TELE